MKYEIGQGEGDAIESASIFVCQSKEMIMVRVWKQWVGLGVVAMVIGVAVCAGAAVKKPGSGRAAVGVRSADPYLGAIVIDAATGQVLFEDKADAQGYPASVIKLMDMMVILERMGNGQVKSNDLVTVTADASKTGGSQVYLAEKEVFSVEDLLYALMIQSANDAAVALAIHVGGGKDGFVELMNQKAVAFGMMNTKFHSVHGLPPATGQEPDVSTARDLAILARELVNKTDILKYTATKERGFRNGAFIMRNHNRLLASFQGCDGFKTGYILAGGFSLVATAERGGRRVIAVVLGSNGSRGLARDAKAAELMSKGFAMLPALPPPAPVMPVAAMETNVVAPEVDEKPQGGGWLMPAVAGVVGGLVVAGIVAWVMKRSGRRTL
jgi:D-alanyl-D-alanine carboxypeptidase (penicillin-binding protein 5/6)